MNCINRENPLACGGAPKPRTYAVMRITLTQSPSDARLWFAPVNGERTMPNIQQIELERENDSGVHAVRGTGGGGHGEQPIDDPPPAEDPEETPAESAEEFQARESEQAFERALVRLPPG